MEIIRKHFSTIDSTNTWAKQHAHELPLDKMTVVTADAQTAGRGRFKRRWESPPGQNIYASFCFFLEKYTQDIGHIPQILALSTANVLEKLEFQPKLKWPNDILLSGKKVGGILAETTLEKKLCLIIGIGLNINMPLEILQTIDRPATSLMVEAKKIFSIESILEKLEKEFIKNLDLFFLQGFPPFLEAYRRSMPILNASIRFHDNRKVWEGTFHGISDEGALYLKMPDGEIKTFITGEILEPV